MLYEAAQSMLVRSTRWSWLEATLDHQAGKKRSRRDGGVAERGRQSALPQHFRRLKGLLASASPATPRSSRAERPQWPTSQAQ